MELALINDKIVPMDKVDPVYHDRGVYFGDGVYEVVRSYEGKIFALTEHLDRFERSMWLVDIQSLNIEQVRQFIEDAYRQSGIANAKIYFHVTRGSHPRNHVAPAGLKPNFYLTITELTPEKDPLEGISVCTHPDWRWKRCDIKSLNLLPNVLARMDAEKKGCQEAILVNEEGEITEGAGSAFFAVFSGEKKLVTRPLGQEILPSITRKIVMQIAKQAGLEPMEKPLTPFQAVHADELFTAVTTKDIVPVVEFDDQKIGNGEVGSVCKTLKKLFREEMKRRIHLEF